MGIFVFVLFFLLPGKAWSSPEASPYGQCFEALEERIKAYCNCEIVENEVLLLTGPTGLQAKVLIDKNVNGLPEVAWVLNEVNKSGYPGRMKSYVETGDRKSKSDVGDTWIIEEKIRKWDLKQSKDGLEMGKPLNVARYFQFKLNKGTCELDSLKITMEDSKTEISKVLDDVSCDQISSGKRLPSSEQGFQKDLLQECEGLKALSKKL
jgi:hypothetical protein